MELIAILMFSLAVSADGFMVGIAYGFRKIRLPIVAMAIIFSASFLAVAIAMILGKGLGSFLHPAYASRLGAGLLIIMGTYYLLQARWQKLCDQAVDDESPVISLNLQSLGIIIQILKEPSLADSDSSGDISPQEALFLGSALAADAFGAGIGLALNGFNIWLTAAAVGLIQFMLINLGLRAGILMENERLKRISPLLAGLLLILLGIYKLI